MNEFRSFGIGGSCNIEIRENDGKTPVIHGTIPFNSETTIKDYREFTEVIRPGAFREAITSDDIVGLFNHNKDFVLGRKSAGTLTLREERDHAVFDIPLPDTQYARDLKVSMDRGDIVGNSFSFTPREGGEAWTIKGGKQYRELTNVKVFDLGPVTFPAYNQSQVAMRSIFAGAGFDFDSLAQIIERGEFNPDDKRVIEVSIEVLSRMIQEPAQEGDSDIQVMAAARQRELELIEIGGNTK